MAMPDFIGIGAQKAGTTWLYDMLAQNPSVWLPPLKEVHYFDSLDTAEKRRGPRGEHILMLAKKLERGHDKGSDGDVAEKAALLRSLVGDHMFTPAWYGSIFDHASAAGKVKGEITPAYLELDARKLSILAEMLPKTKFILIVREPAARAISQLKMRVARSKIDPETEQDWKELIDKLRSNARGQYESAIPLWQKTIDAERLLILPFSEVRDNPAGLIRKVEDFIGATPFDGYESLDEASHKTKDVRVPDWVRAEVETMVASQKRYLIDAFGEDFYNATR